MSKKGEIVIPKKMREESGFAFGAEANIAVRNGAIIITPRSEHIVDRWRRELGSTNIPLTGAIIDAILEDEAEEEYNRLYQNVLRR